MDQVKNDITGNTLSTHDALLSRWRGRRGKTVLLFGGSPLRRDEVVRLVGSALDIDVVGTLSEADGMAALNELGGDVDAVPEAGESAYVDGPKIQRRRYISFELGDASS